MGWEGLGFFAVKAKWVGRCLSLPLIVLSLQCCHSVGNWNSWFSYSVILRVLSRMLALYPINIACTGIGASSTPVQARQ